MVRFLLDISAELLCSSLGQNRHSIPHTMTKAGPWICSTGPLSCLLVLKRGPTSLFWGPGMSTVQGFRRQSLSQKPLLITQNRSLSTPSHKVTLALPCSGSPYLRVHTLHRGALNPHSTPWLFSKSGNSPHQTPTKFVFSNRIPT